MGVGALIPLQRRSICTAALAVVFIAPSGSCGLWLQPSISTFLMLLLRGRYGLAAAQLTRIKQAGLKLTICVEQVVETFLITGHLVVFRRWNHA